MLDREFWITIGSVLLLSAMFVWCLGESEKDKTERRYYLQTIDGDGVQWFVYMTQAEHDRWAAKRYAQIKTGLITGN